MHHRFRHFTSYDVAFPLHLVLFNGIVDRNDLIQAHEILLTSAALLFKSLKFETYN